MIAHSRTKYPHPSTVDLPDRQWPSRTIGKAPIWLSTDLRDGNQALFEPMNAERKLTLFHELVRLGFKEIEVGFPAGSQTDFDVVRTLITDKHIPADVTPMVMTQLRGEQIVRTVESLQGAPRAIVHFYNAVAPLWREVVFGLSVPQVMQLIERNVRLLKDLSAQHPETEWILQYSPKTFCMAELEVSLQACRVAIETWDAGPGRSIIINLPTTVEVSTPNVFADQIEWMHRRLPRRGIAFLLERDHGIVMPRRMQVEFSAIVQKHADASETEISSAALWELFERTYLASPRQDGRVRYLSHQLSNPGATQDIALELTVSGVAIQLNGSGNGPIAATVDALHSRLTGLEGLRIDSYEERSIGSGAQAQAWAIVEAASPGVAGTRFGAARHVNIVTASILAVLSAANHLQS